MIIKLFGLGLTFEASALLLASANQADPAALAALTAAHVGGSLVLAVAVWASLPRGMRSPRGPMLTLLFLSNLFVPVLPVLFRLATALGHRYRQLHSEAPVVAVNEPEYSIYRATDSMQSRGGRTRTKLTNLRVPVSDRLTALLAIQEAPARVSADLLRQLLADPIEDIRLLAYGMIDGKEKTIGMRILSEESRLESTTDSEALYGCNKRLAELYWELAYQKLVQGDMLVHTCNQARHHALEAVAAHDEDAGLWFLLTRVAIELREPDEAETALIRARELGFPRDQLIPYEAELAFLQRRFREIPQLFGTLISTPAALRLSSIYRFWTR
ncbi:MAG: hypothetical protein ACRBC3_02795 [Burkholderiaceae bacterium]